MKPFLASLLVSFCVMFFSCDKDPGTTPASPSPTDPPEIPQTSSVPVITHITFRKADSTSVVKEVYSFTYDEDDRITMVDREDKNLPYVKFNYSNNDLSSVAVYTTIGTVGAVFVANQSLFNGPDTISYYHVFKLFPEDPYDTLFQAYLFKDSLLQKGTIRYASANPDRRSTYDNYICKYDGDKNLLELGFVNTSQQYIKYMDVTATDDKVNPIRYASRQAYMFAISVIDVELLAGMNNITSINYANGTTADLEYTYNEKGWPLTVKVKGQTFVKYEFQYKD